MDNTLGVYVEAFYFTKYNYGSTAGFCLMGQTKVVCHSTGSNAQVFITKNNLYFLTDFRYLEQSQKEVKGDFEIIIYKENIPISAELLEYCRIYGKNPLEYALYGGEDYQTLIISSQKEIPSFIRVGEIKPSSSSKKTIIKTSEGEILPIKGFEHF